MLWRHTIFRRRHPAARTPLARLRPSSTNVCDYVDCLEQSIVQPPFDGRDRNTERESGGHSVDDARSAIIHFHRRGDLNRLRERNPELGIQRTNDLDSKEPVMRNFARYALPRTSDSSDVEMGQQIVQPLGLDT